MKTHFSTWIGMMCLLFVLGSVDGFAFPEAGLDGNSCYYMYHPQWGSSFPDHFLFGPGIRGALKRRKPVVVLTVSENDLSKAGLLPPPMREQFIHKADPDCLFPEMPRVVSGSLVDVDGDGRRELVLYHLERASSFFLHVLKVFRISGSNYVEIACFDLAGKDGIGNSSSNFGFDILDLNRDGFPQLAVSASEGVHGENMVRLFSWKADSMSNKEQLPTGNWVSDSLTSENFVDFIDVNGDGRKELVTTSYMGTTTSAPCMAARYFWPNIFVFADGRIRPADSEFPEFYQALRKECEQLLTGYRKMDESELYPEYFREVLKEYLRLCDSQGALR